ncbi:MAG: argininosuccinate synthase [Nitrospira sp.]|nr:argininosuccinate synthase [Nitrospira sp.]
MKIKSLEELQRTLLPHSKVLLLYSGGLDGSFLLWWLSKQSIGKLFALTIDLGGDLDLSVVREICSNFGAESLVIDKREEFVAEYVAPSIPAQGYYLGGHPICASLSRPLMAKVAVEVACREKIDVLLHSSNVTQNSLRRFNGALESLQFAGVFGSPFEESTITREEKRKCLLCSGGWKGTDARFSSDTNLWGREFENGSLDDPENIDIPEEIFSWTRQPRAKSSRKISLKFERGLPSSLDSVPMGLSKIISRLQFEVGAFGIGRYVGLEEIQNGSKVQEVREMPAATLLYDAYRRLESASVRSECVREKLCLEQLWVREAIEGRWFGLLRESAQEFINHVAARVNGTIEYELDSQGFKVQSLRSEIPRYLRSRGES